MKLNKIALATAVSLLVMTSFGSAATLKMSHVRPQGATIDKELHAFADDVEKATDGSVKIKIYAASALGDYTTVQERVSVGAVDMSTQPVASGVERRLQISSFPYLTTSWAQAKKVYGPNGVVRDAVTELLQAQDISVLAAYPVYFGGISLNTDAIAPGDPEVQKGIKIRVPGSKSFQLTGEALGYIPSPIPFSEAFTAIQTGVVDGVIGSGAEGYYASFRDVTKTYIPANTHFEVWYVMVSNSTLADLSDEENAALIAAAKTFEEKRWGVAEEEQAKNEQRLADELGTKIVDLSDEQLAAMADKVHKDVWPEVLKDIGVEWGQSILDKVNE